jgi:RNA polymerase sigma factor (sigma-70 family)
MKPQYDDYKKKITKIVKSWHNRRPDIDIDDLRQEAYLAFCQAVEGYDESKGTFITYMWRCINNQIIYFVKTGRTQIPCEGKYTHNSVKALPDCDLIGWNDLLDSDRDNDYLSVSQDNNAYQPDFFSTCLNNLGEDALDIIKLIFDTPQDLLDMIPVNFSLGLRKGILEKYLRNKGWAGNKVKFAFKEIEKAIY